MRIPAALDLEVRATEEGKSESRIQLYVKSTGELAAWVLFNKRDSDGSKVLGASIHYVKGKNFSADQVAAHQRWVHKILSAAMSL